MIQLVVLTTEPASPIAVVTVEQHPDIAAAVSAMNDYAATWRRKVEGDGLTIDDFSLPYNDQDDPSKLDAHNTWLSAGQRENEFIAAWREIK